MINVESQPHAAGRVRTKPDALPASQWPRYQVYGASMASDFVFANRLLATDRPADFTFSCQEPPPILAGSLQTIYSTGMAQPGGDLPIGLYSGGGWHLIRYSTEQDYYVSSDRIICHRRILSPHTHQIEIGLLGAALAIWNELRGCSALHAAALVVDGNAVGLVGYRGAGKTTLSVALMERGAALLEDDLLVVKAEGGRFMAQPGYPQIRLWPDQTTRLYGEDVELPRVHPESVKRRIEVGSGGIGRFFSKAAPLTALYLLERTEIDAPVVQPLDEAAALLLLLRHSFLPEIGLALIDQTPRLAHLASLLATVPVRKLIYPAGATRLDEVCDVLRSDLAQNKMGGPDHDRDKLSQLANAWT